jgi:hypothetical protein
MLVIVEFPLPQKQYACRPYKIDNEKNDDLVHVLTKISMDITKWYKSDSDKKCNLLHISSTKILRISNNDVISIKLLIEKEWKGVYLQENSDKTACTSINVVSIEILLITIHTSV